MWTRNPEHDKRCLLRSVLPGNQGKSQAIFLFTWDIFIVGSLDDFRIELLVPKATWHSYPMLGKEIQAYERDTGQGGAWWLFQHPGWREPAGAKSSNNGSAYCPGHKRWQPRTRDRCVTNHQMGESWVRFFIDNTLSHPSLTWLLSRFYKDNLSLATWKGRLSLIPKNQTRRRQATRRTLTL